MFCTIVFIFILGSVVGIIIITVSTVTVITMLKTIADTVVTLKLGSGLMLFSIVTIDCLIMWHDLISGAICMAGCYTITGTALLAIVFKSVLHLIRWV